MVTCNRHCREEKAVNLPSDTMATRGAICDAFWQCQAGFCPNAALFKLNLQHVAIHECSPLFFNHFVVALSTSKRKQRGSFGGIISCTCRMGGHGNSGVILWMLVAKKTWIFIPNEYSCFMVSMYSISSIMGIKCTKIKRCDIHKMTKRCGCRYLAAHLGKSVSHRMKKIKF